ncbi:GTP pyrophosphokinase [Bacillus mycoides]|uniref:GTP pyrophosphokinase n=1 Tax=Bacillus mycoides TaxID=1405 RepID=UPI001C0244FA|nr:GTP pyrophosphokinase family protein [Bacillus mycoides]MCQ6534813.1 GTP pyrophosphokinase family protein [Bacillus mycoides]QWH54143.1 GTP pyrophosphokinase family protein [Bacillus mycoides]QWI14367.1 GTP pyrophosphokinase family protein [Bacillus mycoides]QWI57979.1 GTP pyrophosphokinase family protein [Bacillus mycoides]QWI92613.1 GTP pyrophosphokinase family protein [Bacillus mycoides]
MEDVRKWGQFLLPYKFALDEMTTKINIIAEEAKYLKNHNQIEHIKTRLKSFESIQLKLDRKGISPTMSNSREQLYDIAGMRIICSFVNDIYDIYSQLSKRNDIKIVQVKDYIENPKSNGYQSLHVIVQIPVTLSKKVETVYVEIQLRTLAMDFWASLEHKIYYKYDKKIPFYLEQELIDAAKTAKSLDEKMRDIHVRVEGLKG